MTRLAHKPLSSFTAGVIMFGFSILLVAGFSQLKRRFSNCDNDSCRTPDKSVGSVPSIIGKQLYLNNELLGLAAGKGIAILFSTGCSSCKRVNYSHLSALAKKQNLALVWISSVEPSSPPSNFGFLESKTNIVSFASLVAKTPSLSSVAPQVFIIEKSGLVKEHLIGAAPINSYEVPNESK